MTHVVRDEFGISHTWGRGREVVFLSNPLADPVSWSGPARGPLVDAGYRVTACEHRCRGLGWRGAVSCITRFVSARPAPVALVGWSQAAVLAREVALAAPRRVTCAALLATYGRQNEIGVVLQAGWDLLAAGGAELDPLRLAMSLLTAFPPEQLARDGFGARMRSSQQERAGRPDRGRRRRSAGSRRRTRTACPIFPPCASRAWSRGSPGLRYLRRPRPRGGRRDQDRNLPRAARPGARGTSQRRAAGMAARHRVHPVPSPRLRSAPSAPPSTQPPSRHERRPRQPHAQNRTTSA